MTVRGVIQQKIEDVEGVITAYHAVLYSAPQTWRGIQALGIRRRSMGSPTRRDSVNSRAKCYHSSSLTAPVDMSVSGRRAGFLPGVRIGRSLVQTALSPMGPGIVSIDLRR